MLTGIDVDKKEHHRSSSQPVERVQSHHRHRDASEGARREGSREGSRGREFERREQQLDRREQRDERSNGAAGKSDSSMRGQQESLPPLGRPRRSEQHRGGSSGAPDQWKRKSPVQERGGERDERRLQSPPVKGSASEGGGRRFAGSSPLVAELQKLCKNLIAEGRAPRGGSESGIDDERGQGSGSSDAEQGEIQGSEDEDDHAAEAGGSGRKRKHAPIVWSPTSKAGKSSRSLLDRAFEEAEQFKAMQMEEFGLDPDAPPAMKSSPSFSDDRSGSFSPDPEADDVAAIVITNDGEQELDHEHETDNSPQLKTGLASRWLAEEGGDIGSGAKVASTRMAHDGSMPPGAGSGAAGGEMTSSSSSAGGGGFAASPDVGGETVSARSMPNRYDMMSDCRSVEEFEKINRISEGTYGVVYKAREKKTGRLVALKRIKMEKERDGFPITSIREINILLNFNHKNIVNVNEVVMSPKNPDHIFMVMELMDHDLKSLMEDKSQMARPFSVAEVKCLMYQLLEGMEYLHTHWVLHRDLKTSNILYNAKGELKICDFGLARQYGSPLRTYTHTVVTLWYRPPELLFGQRHYSTAVDVWSLGCIMGELLLGKPLFAGQSEMDQLDKICNLLGTPSLDQWPGLKKLPNYGKIVLKPKPSELRNKFQASYGGGAILSESGFDLLSSLLAFDPERRIPCDEAMKHRWFSEAPLPTKKELMPMFNPRKEDGGKGGARDDGGKGGARANMF